MGFYGGFMGFMGVLGSQDLRQPHVSWWVIIEGHPWLLRDSPVSPPVAWDVASGSLTMFNLAAEETAICKR